MPQEDITKLTETDKKDFWMQLNPKLAENLVSKKEIDTFKNDTIYIELASFPGGIDKHYAKSKNINIIVASKLPSRYSKETAGYLIGEAIDKMIKEGKV